MSDPYHYQFPQKTPMTCGDETLRQRALTMTNAQGISKGGSAFRLSANYAITANHVAGEASGDIYLKNGNGSFTKGWVVKSTFQPTRNTMEILQRLASLKLANYGHDISLIKILNTSDIHPIRIAQSVKVGTTLSIYSHTQGNIQRYGNVLEGQKFFDNAPYLKWEILSVRGDSGSGIVDCNDNLVTIVSAGGYEGQGSAWMWTGWNMVRRENTNYGPPPEVLSHFLANSPAAGELGLTPEPVGEGTPGR